MATALIKRIEAFVVDGGLKGDVVDLPIQWLTSYEVGRID